MNLLDCVVTKIVSGPHERSSGFWSIEVKQNCWGREESNILYFETKEEAEAVKVGYKYQA